MLLFCSGMRETETGVIINCEVKPKSKVFSIAWSDDVLNISVTSMAVENKANKEVVEILHNLFKVPKNRIKIVSGHKSKSKSVLVEEINKEDAKNKLEKIN
ncbi:uncharacterized protein NEMIN01_1015 [Nematocida minor]|uniref:uncharacterized protein n=1 Tax=Nematocida minor TaxID=1912983 RepID=UPI00221EEE52|nr:uncharacterized protein NEMIN01_1015 [Nematocida minor]KAI5190391.1 uncharacterized protein NEMIN01_1015 [Nematocida minor]